MEPQHCSFARYEHKDAFTVVGVQETIPFAEMATKMPSLVQKFFEKCGEIKNTKSDTTYGLCFDVTESQLTYLLGREVTKVEDLSEGLVSKEVGGHEYAVIAHKGSKDKLSETYPWFYAKWLPESGCEMVHLPSFEVCDERFIPMGPDVDKSYLEIYFPVKKPAGDKESKSN